MTRKVIQLVITDNMTPRNFSRVNGWSLPPHPLQILAWIVVVFLVITTFALVIPSLASLAAQITLYVIIGICVLVTLIINVAVTTLDPADQSVRNKVKNGPRPQFDRQQHRHVIDENYYCNICETSIHPSSKHCRQCNKCILDFDHHCKWLNNCVGARNYKLFLIYVVVTTVCSFLILLLSLTVFALNFAQPGVLLRKNGYLTVFGAEVVDAVWITLISLTIVISCVIFALTLHLLIFHLRLIAKGLTTYNFIMQQRRETEQQEQQKENDVQAAQSVSGVVISRTTPPEDASAPRAFSLLTKLKSCFSKKQQESQQENRIEPETNQMNNKFMQVSQKQKAQAQNDALDMVDVSSNSPSQEIEKKHHTDLIKTPVEVHRQQSPVNVQQDEYSKTSVTLRAHQLPSLTRGTSTNSNVPYTPVPVPQVTSDYGGGGHTKMLDINSNHSTIPHLPPIENRVKTNSSSRETSVAEPRAEAHHNRSFAEIYEPLVESVFLTDSSKELTLPTITLDPPDSEHMTDELMNEIPISAFENNNHVAVQIDSNKIVTARVDSVMPSSDPGLYYASGQFTVTYRRPNIVTASHVNSTTKPNIWYINHGLTSSNEETLSQHSNSSSTVSTRRVRFDAETTM